MKDTLIIRRRHGLRDESGKLTGEYTVSVECLSGLVASTEINIDEEQNIISIEGFGDLKKCYDCYYSENIVTYKEKETVRESRLQGKITVKSFEIENFVEAIFLNGHQIFDVEWCFMLQRKKNKKLYKRENESEWVTGI